jgi:hypothetical protein
MLNDRENILSALREKPLKVYEIMKRANVVNEEACQSLLLKMRDEGLVKFDIHKGRWLVGWSAKMGVWSYDFVEVQTHDGRKLRLMTLIDEFTRSPPFGASENLTIPRHTGHAVQIEPNLRSQSPKNGNISNMRRRLSAFSPQSCANLESGDRLPIQKNSQLAGVYAICDYTISSCWTGWLTWEDSNLHIPALKMPFEMSGEFRTFSRKFGPETSGTILPILGNMGDRGRKCRRPWELTSRRHLRSVQNEEIPHFTGARSRVAT